MLHQYFQYLALFVLFGLFEIFYPAISSKNHKGRFRNIIYSLILVFIGGGVVTALLKVLPFQPRIVLTSGIEHTVLLTLAYLIVFDLLFYWYHRAQHTFSLLWPIHELHHADTEINVTTTLRSYWLEQPIQNILIYFPLFYILGYNEQSVSFFVIILIVMLVFSHANVRLSLGPFTSIIVGPQLHRIHHSKKRKHYDKNFAQFLPIIDIVFGTYYKPHKNEFPSSGTPNLASDESIISTLLKPFQEWRNKIRTGL